MLGGWEPKTREQLETVETLLEVAGIKHARFSRYRVDEDGEATLLETADRKRLRGVDRGDAARG